MSLDQLYLCPKHPSNKGSQIDFTKDTHTEEQFGGNNNRDEFEEWSVHTVDENCGHEIADVLKHIDFHLGDALEKSRKPLDQGKSRL